MTLYCLLDFVDFELADTSHLRLIEFISDITKGDGSMVSFTARIVPALINTPDVCVAWFLDALRSDSSSSVNGRECAAERLRQNRRQQDIVACSCFFIL